MVQLITLSTPTRVEVELGYGCCWAVTICTSLCGERCLTNLNILKGIGMHTSKITRRKNVFFHKQGGGGGQTSCGNFHNF